MCASCLWFCFISCGLFFDVSNYFTKWKCGLNLRVSVSLLQPARNVRKPCHFCFHWGISFPEDGAIEDGELLTSEPENSLTRVHSVSPGSRSPSLMVHDLRGSSRRTGSSRRSLTVAPSSTTRERRAAAQATLSHANQQSLLDEVRAAQTMYLRRRQVSLEDTVAHSLSGADLVRSSNAWLFGIFKSSLLPIVSSIRTVDGKLAGICDGLC